MSRLLMMTMFHNARLRPTRLRAALSATVLAFTPALAHGQAIERHTPSPVEGRSGAIAPPNALPTQEDDTPIGPDLRALRVIGDAPSPNAPTLASGVDVTSVARLAAVRTAAEADLKPFLGRKLSRKLIAEIEAAIARRYRMLGYPFVSLSTPEQDISGGALQVQVTEFVVGKISTPGAPAADADDLTHRVGLKPHDPINAARLGDNLAWLNLYPYRAVHAVFTPGASPGAAGARMTSIAPPANIASNRGLRAATESIAARAAAGSMREPKTFLRAASDRTGP